MRSCKSLKQQGNVCNILQHGAAGIWPTNSLKSLAIPAGFEPATHGVEIRYSVELSGLNFEPSTADLSLAQGNGWVIDLDLEKFFDRVNHDKLMGKLPNGSRTSGC